MFSQQDRGNPAQPTRESEGRETGVTTSTAEASDDPKQLFP